MGVSRNRWFTIAVAVALAVPIAAVEAALTPTAAGAGITAYSDPTLSEPYAITKGPDGALWFTNLGNNSIGRISTTGAITNFTDPSISGPYDITAGPDGALWFTNSDSNSIGRITTAGVVTNYTDPELNSISTPYKIVAGSDGALWFTNYYGQSIGRITTAGDITSYTDPSISYPYAITAGPDGALWFTNLGNYTIGRITTAGAVTSYGDSGLTYAYDITAGPDGALWFTNYYSSNSIGRITTAGDITTYTDPSISYPYGITAGPDGALWYTDYSSSNSIGRITTAGDITHYTDPNISDPWGITAGPDGALWYTNLGTYTIGRITTDTPGSCGNECVVVVVVAKPGQTASSGSGPPTDARPTKQTLTLPTGVGGGAVRVTFKSIAPGASTSTIDKQLCPTTGSAPRCSGQISVIAGNFKKFVSRAHPIRMQVIAKWKTKVPVGQLLLSKDTGAPPMHLPRCVRKNGLYNTPCALPEVVSGSAARNNLITTDTVLFVGNDPHLSRRDANLPDAPTAVKATAGKKQAVVQWKAPSWAPGGLIGFLVTPHLGRTSLRPVSVGASATKTTIKGLTTGKAYTFTVAAKNRHGLSLPSLPTKAIKPI